MPTWPAPPQDQRATSQEKSKKTKATRGGGIRSDNFLTMAIANNIIISRA
ncbi:MAG: hypothetical protein ORN57_03405 [Alphaproteobacteria bacterium]|nr:hypothetical protein [Alphaproteobacteria bacterium]